MSSFRPIPFAASLTWVLLTTATISGGSNSDDFIPIPTADPTAVVKAVTPELFSQVEELTPIPHPGVDFKAYEAYGSGMAVTEEFLAVGAPSATILGGAVYIYQHGDTDWSLVQKVRAEPGAAEIGFGGSVAMNDRYLVVGARYGHSEQTWSCGAVYIFERTDGLWRQTQQINAEDAEAEAQFGYSVAIHDDLLVVGAYDASGATNSHAGAVYVFRSVDGHWTQSSKITRPDETEERYFGTSVVTDGETIIAAASAQREAHGEVFVYSSQATGWTLEQQIDLAALSWGRSAISVSGEWMAVVGNLDSEADQHRVLVYRHEAGSWNHRQTIAPTTVGDEALEVDVARLVTSRLVVGISRDDEVAYDAGAVLVYSVSGDAWQLDEKLTVPPPSDGKRLGRTLAITSNTIIAEASGTTPVHVFEEIDEEWSHIQALGWWNVEKARMGWSVAKSGNTVVAGAPFYDHPGIESCGAVWVFHQTDGRWDMQEMLLADEPEADARFGKSVAIRGDLLVVGAPADGYWSNSPGAAYIFQRAGGVWRLSQELNGRGTSSSGQFGSAVAIGDGMLFVSDPRDEDGGKSGVVYVYNVVDDLYQESQILVPSGAEPYDEFGASLALGNEELLVGAPWQDSGVVYVYSRLNGVWTESNEITASDGAQALEFGKSISTDGITLVVGAPGGGDSGENLTGSAVVFVSDGGTWLEDSALVPTSATSLSRVGSSVAVSEDQIVVGSPGIDVGGTSGAGATHVFSRIGGQWHEQLLTVPDPEVGDQFGRAVAAEGGSFVIAAPDENEIWGSDAGSVYVFEPTTEVIDLDVTITNNQDLCIPGEMQEYTIVFANQSSIDVRNARVVATFPREFEYDSREWSCRSTGGATCRLPLWTKRLHEEVDLPAGSSLEYTAKGRVTHGWSGEETSFAAAILPPPGLADSETTNNEAIDIDPVEPHVDLVATITNGRDHLVNGQRTSYGIVVQNIGPSRAVQASVLDTPPDSLQECSWTCHDEREPFIIHSLCGSPSSGEGAIDQQVWINPGHSVYFVLTCDVDAVTPTCTNRVEVFADREVDTDGSNNFSEDEDPIIEIPGGLARTVSGRIIP